MVGIDEPDGLRSIFRVLTYGLILNTEGKLKHKTTIRCNLTVLFELLPDWPFSQFIPQDGAKKSLFLERMNCCYSGDKASPTVFRFAQIGCLFSPGREWFCQTFLFLEYNAWNGDLLIYLFILPCCGCLIGPKWEMWGFSPPPAPLPPWLTAQAGIQRLPPRTPERGHCRGAPLLAGFVLF